MNIGTEPINCYIFDVCKETVNVPNNNRVKDVVRIKSPDWVMAIVRNKATGKYVVVKEFRYGILKEVMECPCGKIEPNEAPEAAVLRELKEEIGAINPRIVTPLYTTYTNIAFMDNAQYGFFVEVDGLGEQSLDEDEFLTVHEVDAVGLRNCTELNPDASMSQKYLYAMFERFIATTNE